MSTDILNIEQFIVKELVGQGSFSEVYNCTLPGNDNCMFAIKRLLSTCSSKKIVNEVTSLYMVKVVHYLMHHLKDCPNTIHLLGVIMQQDCLNLIFPMIEYDEFTLFIKDCKFRSVKVLFFYYIAPELYAESTPSCFSNSF